MPNLLEQLSNLLPDAVFKFFVLFSRFEYALKEAGYIRRTTRAEPDWNKFADHLGQAFLEQVRKSGKAGELLSKPPMRQVVQDGRLGFERASSINDAKSLFKAIRCARNNLVHGGKFSPPGSGLQRERDQTLLEQARGILEMALEECESVKRAFNQLD